MTRMVHLGVAGARGRMGRAVSSVIDTRQDVVCAVRFDRETLPDFSACDAIVDFTTPEASANLAEHCAALGHPALVIGSTGFEPEHEAKIQKAAEKIAIVKAGNYSLGVNLLMGLVRQAAAKLRAEDWDIEVFEAHHNRKVDAPSGTALMLGQSAAAGRGVDLDAVRHDARSGITGPRPKGEIGFSVMRAGGIIGEHSVLIAAEDEIITLAHSARDRSLFARGAVEAAIWVAGKPAGLYDMQDVLGLGSA